MTPALSPPASPWAAFLTTTGFEALLNELTLHTLAEAEQMHEALRAALTARFGPADAAQTELVQPQRYPPHRPPAWRTPDGWLALYEHLGTGDGDAWWELWLHAAPSTQALGAATASRSGQGARA